MPPAPAGRQFLPPARGKSTATNYTIAKSCTGKAGPLFVLARAAERHRTRETIWTVEPLEQLWDIG